MSKQRAMADSCKTLLDQKPSILRELGLAQSSRTLDDLKDTKTKQKQQEAALAQELPKVDHAIATGSGAMLAQFEELTNSKIDVLNGQAIMTKDTKKQILDIQAH